MRYSDAPARREELLRRLGEHGYVSSSAVADEFGVSEMTIRRDLRQLHLEGYARRVAGGASLPLGTVRGASFEERDRHAGREKAAIARECATELIGVAAVALDAGTTVAAIAELLTGGATVVSHSLPVVLACTDRDDLQLIALGGNYQSTTRSFTGAPARDGLSRLAVDIAVLSATAIEGSALLCANEADAEIKQAMMAAARRTIVVADSSKIGGRAPIRFADLDSVDLVITSDAVPTELRDHLSAARVRYAEVPVEAVP